MHIIIPLEAVTKKNHSRIVSVNKHLMLIPSKQYLDFEKACAPYLWDYREAIDKPVNLKAVFYRSTKRRVDLPNLLNAICDILVKYGVVVDDNCKIIASFDGSCCRYDKTNPRIELEITEGEKCWE